MSRRVVRLRLLRVRQGRLSPRLVLVRHGRSAHVQTGWIDAEGLRTWVGTYDAAGLAPDQVPPAALRALAARADVIVSSDMPRARASAALLAGHGVVVESSLLRELELSMPGVRYARLPLPVWALVVGVGRAVRALRGSEPPAGQLERAEAAATWLAGLAEDGGATVLAVTHASFRRLLLRVLVSRGWRVVHRSGWVRPWSACTLECAAGAGQPFRSSPP